jgi:hypothetical protein
MNKEGWIWKHVGQNEKKRKEIEEEEEEVVWKDTDSGEAFLLRDLRVSDNFKRRKRQNYSNSPTNRLRATQVVGFS